ncbi:MAG: hypothetical protein WC511_00920 [Candidatus Pacearchaeota archaeon]
MSEEKKKSWFKKHKILSGLGIFVLLIIIISAANSRGDSTNSENTLSINSKDLLPQESEIDREWIFDPSTSITSTENGFVEGTELQVSKAESFSGSAITMRAYKFDNSENANNFYTQSTEKIDIRGVSDWDLGNNCFGIDQEAGLAGSAEGYCLRNNIVFYVESISSSFLYASDGKDFMKIMLEKI